MFIKFAIDWNFYLKKSKKVNPNFGNTLKSKYNLCKFKTFKRFWKINTQEYELPDFKNQGTANIRL